MTNVLERIILPISADEVHVGQSEAHGSHAHLITTAQPQGTQWRNYIPI